MQSFELATMKIFKYLCLVVSFFFTMHLFGSPAELTNVVSAIYLAPPAGFQAHFETHQYAAPNDGPFDLDGPDFLSYVKFGRNGGRIAFQPGMVGAYVGAGKAVHFKRVDATLLKDELENQCDKKFGGATSAGVETIDGYIAADLTVSRSLGGHPRFLNFCWIQIEGNEVLKVTSYSDDTNTFAAMIDCLKSLTIDKRRYFSALNLKEATVSTNQLTRIEIGHVTHNGIPFGYCVLHTEQKIYSFNVWWGIGGKELDAPKIYFKRLEDYSKSPNSLRIVVIDLTSKYRQNTINIEAETNATEVAEFQLGDIRSPAFQLGSPYMSVIFYFAENGIPDGFKEEAEYKVKATLFIRKPQTAPQ